MSWTAWGSVIRRSGTCRDAGTSPVSAFIRPLMNGNPLLLVAHIMWLGFWVPDVIPRQISRIHAGIRKQVLQAAGHDGRPRHGRQALDTRSAIAEAMAKMDHPKGSGLFRTGDLKKSVTSNGDCPVFILVVAGGTLHSGRRKSFASTAVLGTTTLVGGTSLAVGPCISSTRPWCEIHGTAKTRGHDVV